MLKEILSAAQVTLLPLVQEFKREYYLVGGTAIALHIGHRQSIDFDLFKFAAINHKRVIAKIASTGYKYSVTRRVTEQLNVNINEVKFTFFEFPYNFNVTCKFDNVIKLPDLLTLAAMKAYAVGRRSKWKDYVDLFFIIKYHYTIKQISSKTLEIFGDLFSEKLFRAQISFFDDIDYSEQVTYLGQPVNVDDIKSFLIEKAIDIL